MRLSARHKQKLAAVTAYGIMAGIVSGSLILLYELKSKPQTIWPFPRNDRILPAAAEIILWMIVVIALACAIVVLFAVLFKAAGWYRPNLTNDVWSDLTDE